MASAAIFGSTGAVGSKILDTVLSSDSFNSIKTISRRLPKAQSPKLEAIQEADTSKWGPMIASISPKPDVIFNAVGTTRAIAGGIQNQWKIDHDLCIEIAKAAKEAGVKTYVFISSAGTRGLLSGYVLYSKMKVGVENAIRELDFEQAIIVRPGMILGEREKPKAPFFEWLLSNTHKVSQGLQDSMGQDQRIIGKAAVAAARQAQEGKAPSKYWVLEQADVVRLGRTEWKD
ncbi:Protein fmp52-2, mitochondrial [Pseudocercospora fuligena]|uniref:Protein fmp52-2, mitochondrial n=1 Tax=Pseudocercospora fuligena TaxID=685502 RepID=A0A8H6RQU7_9PEZI|nr:Protein fmp52-2, mitochondrial [Pseudocercospora fuligena]